MGRSRKYKGGAKTISRERKNEIIAAVRRLIHIASNCDTAVANAAGEIDSDELYRLIEKELGADLLKLKDNEKLKKGTFYGYTRVNPTAEVNASSGAAAAPAPKSFFSTIGSTIGSRLGFGSSTPEAPAAAPPAAPPAAPAASSSSSAASSAPAAAGEEAGAAAEGAEAAPAEEQGVADTLFGREGNPNRPPNTGGRRSYKSKKSRSHRRRTRRTFR